MPRYEVNSKEVLELCSKFTSVSLIAPLPEDKAKDPAMVASAFLHQSLTEAMARFFQFEHEDIKHCYAMVNLNSIGAEECVMHLMIPDDFKRRPMREQLGAYETLDSFVRRLIKKSDNITAQIDDVVGHIVNIHFRPQAMIDAMQLLAHEKYRGDPIAVNHLYIAQHMLDQFQARQPFSELKIH